jgi:hypothetical protein
MGRINNQGKSDRCPAFAVDPARVRQTARYPVGILSGVSWQNDFRLLGVSSEDHGHIADSLDQFAPGLVDNLLNELIPLIPVTGTDLDLDEFMMIQGNADFLQYGFTQAVLADHDYGFEFVRQAAKMSVLGMREWHGWTPGKGVD